MLCCRIHSGRFDSSDTARAHSSKYDAQSFSRDMNFIIYPMSQNGNCSLNLRVNIKCEFFTDVNISTVGSLFFFLSSWKKEEKQPRQTLFLWLEAVWARERNSQCKCKCVSSLTLALGYTSHRISECVQEINRQSWFPLSIVSMMSMHFTRYSYRIILCRRIIII